MTEELINRIPKFSVIIPVYRVEKFICQCIDSVLAQTFNDFELILVDDGSPDSSGDICDKYTAIDDRIIVVHKPNSGVSGTRNAGLAVARGEYIYFLDSDDWIDCGLLECAAGNMDKGYDMVVFNYYSAFPKRISTEITHVSGEFDLYKDNSRIEFFLSSFLKAELGWSVWDRVFKKSIIDKGKITYADYNKILMEDMYFTCCYCAFAKRILSVDDRLLYYRQREGSLMHTNGTGLNINRINEFGKALHQYYIEAGCELFVDIFPQIYYCLIRNNIWRLEKQKKLSLSEIRELIIDDIDDISFFKTQMRGLQRQKYFSEKAYSKREFMDMKSTAKYLLNGKEFSYNMRNRFINAFSKK